MNTVKLHELLTPKYFGYNMTKFTYTKELSL